jgi:hypothetical protein
MLMLCRADGEFIIAAPAASWCQARAAGTVPRYFILLVLLALLRGKLRCKV